MDAMSIFYMVVYLIYVIWMLAYIDDTEYMSLTVETIMGLCIILLVILVAFYLSLWYNSSSITFKVAIALCLVFLVCSIVYYFIRQYATDIAIREKLDLYPPRLLQITTDRETIAQRLLNGTDLHLDANNINMRLEVDLKASPDVYFNLYWYLMQVEGNINHNLTRDEKLYVISRSNEQLLDILGPTYVGCRDRASLLFAVIYGLYLPHRDNVRYEEVSKYTPQIVYNLVANQNLNYPPYVQLAQQQITPIETLLNNITVDTVSEVIDRFGLRPDNYLDTLSLEEKIKYIQRDLSSYARVFNRKSGITPIDLSTTNLSRMEIRDELMQYTNNELVQIYEPRKWWVDRNTLIDNIIADARGDNTWSWTHGYCNNDNTMNIVSLDLHGDHDKTSVINPTLSYGKHKNYRCYQLDELTEAFHHQDGCFLFTVPDWNPDLNINREFTVDSIKQLLELLESAPDNYEVKPLITKIKYGLKCVKAGGHIIRSIIVRYNNFTEDQKSIALLYLVWMFCFAMWMRFWEGPGNPWPIKRSIGTYNRGHTSSKRKQHVIIQSFVRSRIMEMYDNDEELKAWVNDLPVIYYDFETKDCTYTTNLVKQEIDGVIFEERCMGFGADIILKSAYKLLVDLMPNVKIDTLVANNIGQLSEIELQVVENMLRHATLKNADRQVVNQRRINLTIPQQAQPDFDPTGYRSNVHVE